MTFLTVVGHVNIDIVFNVNEIPSFGSEEVKSIERRLGGTGANIARFASVLGTPVELISRISTSFPEDLLRPLKRENLKLTLERDGAEGPICYIADAKENQVAFMFQGPMNAIGKSYDLASDYCHFATSNPDWILKLMSTCKGKSVLDPGQEIRYRWERDKLVEAVKRSDLIILNEAEFNYLSSFVGLDPDRTIVTLGRKGVMFSHETFETDLITSVSSLGAGDAFRGGFYAALYRGKDIKEAIVCANRVTSFYLKNEMDTSMKFNWGDAC